MGADQPVEEWIDSVCRRFSRVTGWPLIYVSIHQDPLTHCTPSDAELRSQWQSNVSNGMEVIGTLRLGQYKHRQRDASYLQACELAELAVRLIERVLMTQASNERLRVSLNSPSVALIGRGVSVTVDRQRSQPQSVMYVDRMLSMASRLTGYPAVALFLRKRGTEELNLSMQWGPQWLEIPHSSRMLEMSPIDAACLDGGLRIINRTSAHDEETDFLPTQATTGVCQGICVSDDALGTLWLYDRRDRRLTLRDRHVITSVAARLGELIERTILLDESAHSQRMRVELQVAARSLPAATIQHRGTEGWYELACHSQASDEVGGDLFEIIPLSDDRVFVAIGDAAGHSIPAALVMASVRGAIRALLDASDSMETGRIACSPQQILTRINSVLHGIVKSHQFMTMFCAIIDGRRLQMEYANAGHPPALLIRNGEVQQLDSHGLVLGVLDTTTYNGTIVPLREHDLVAFYTDGVSEAVNATQSMFGHEAITDMAFRHSSDSAAAIADRVWGSLQGHLSDNSTADDRTLAVLRINSRLSPPQRQSEQPVRAMC